MTPQPLEPNAISRPEVVGLHADSANRNSTPDTGPIANGPTTTSAQLPLAPLLVNRAGQFSAGYAHTKSGSPVEALAAVDPATLAVTAEWDAPAGQTLNYGYMYQDEHATMLVSSRQGHIYIVTRHTDGNRRTLTLARDINLAATGVLGQKESLLNAAFDTAGNVWFTTGGIIGTGQDAGTSTTLGYISPDGKPHVRHLRHQAVENGIAVSGTTAYVVTGPPATDTTTNTGTIYAFTRDSTSAVATVWSQNYQAGHDIKPGGFARGSGSTPTLLGNRYVAITDNADNQIHLQVYRQGAAVTGQSQLVCSTPLFSPGSSANDIGLVGADGGGKDSVVALDDFDAPQVQTDPSDINGGFNNMNQMAPGVEKLTIDGHNGTCPMQWNTPIRIKSVPVLSTATGLLYGYAQDPVLAAKGLYAWYFTALDYRTGALAWQSKAGVGGTYNDSYKGATLSPNGTLYQGIEGGVATLKDANPR